MNNQVVVRPIISEKSFALAGSGVYVFLVSSGANKSTVATQIHEQYKVDVVGVNIVNIPGKLKKVGRKSGKRSDTKKALVKVKAGQKIAIFETEEEKKDKKSEKADKPQIEETTSKEEIKK